MNEPLEYWDSLFRRYTDQDITDLLEETDIISFEHSENGTIIVCR